MKRGVGPDLLYRPGAGARPLVFLGLCLLSTASAAADLCAPVIGRLVSLQGRVEIVRGAGPASAGALNQALCAGDQVRVRDRSRAAVALTNQTTLRLDQGSTLSLGAPAGDASAIELCAGALYIITRTPQRRFRVTTPFVNANVEGTEFLVEVERSAEAAQCRGEASALTLTPLRAERSRITLVEGRVRAENPLGSVELDARDESTSATAGAAPTQVTIRPIDAVTWPLYMPTILDFQLEAGLAASALQQADPQRSARIGEALAALEASAGRDTAAVRVQRAGLLLLLGRIDEANRLLAPVLAAGGVAADPARADAHALAAVVAVAENRNADALTQATTATQLAPGAPAAWLALSVAQQALFRLEEALASARMADSLVQPQIRVELPGQPPNPRRALALVRVAELQMALGDLSGARASAEQAGSANPQLARTHSVMGFAHLLRIDLPAARRAFERAIEIDQSDPLPRLGLGLTRIRAGQLAEGRAEIEIAAALDPRDALVRSYLGKAYDDERRDGPAGTQFGLAKRLDPNDPTPWFYDAIRLQAANRPADALRELDRSIVLNGNRAVYRSRLLLDSDHAARSADLSAIHGQLGFGRVSVLQSVKTLAESADSEAAHRQLAIAYADEPRHDVARVSEALQSQLRLPPTPATLGPQITSDKLLILRDTGPTRLGANEFNALFGRDPLRLQLDVGVGSHGLRTDQFVLSGVAGPVSYALTQLHYGSRGSAPNDDATRNLHGVFVQAELSDRARVQFEFKRSRLEFGDELYAYDPDFHFPARLKESSEIARLGGRYAVGPGSEFIWNAMSETAHRQIDLPLYGISATASDIESEVVELQHVRRFGPHHAVFGAGHIRQVEVVVAATTERRSASNAYAYAFWKPGAGVTLLTGLAQEQVQLENPSFGTVVERDQLSPKLGAMWSGAAGTTLRAAAFSVVKRPFVGSMTIEPTQVLGFNQFYSGFAQYFGEEEGTLSRRRAIALDQRFGATTFAGLEASRRSLRVPLLGRSSNYAWRETAGRVYLYTLPLGAGASPWQVSAHAEFEQERLQRETNYTGPEGIVDVTTRRLPLGIEAFHASGLTLRVGATRVRQQGRFTIETGYTEVDKSEQGWIVDASLEYRMPRRRGIVTVGVKNLFDRRLELFESDPFNPRNATRRLLMARVKWLM